MTTDLPQHHIVTLALFLKGGAERFVDTEDVAIKANDIAPGRFCWRKYPDQINLELVRVFLSDAKKPDKGVLVSGSGRKGWTLTPKGLKLAKDTEKGFLSGNISLGTGAEKAGSVDSVRRSRELNRITSSEAWRKWADGNIEISVADAKHVFRIDSYSKGEMLKLKMDRLQKIFIDDDKTSSFLTEIRNILVAGE